MGLDFWSIAVTIHWRPRHLFRIDSICIGILTDRDNAWHWLTAVLLENESYWLWKGTEIGKSMLLPKSPNLWLHFSQREKKNEMLIASSISYLLSTTGSQLKTIYEMEFVLVLVFRRANEIELTRMLFDDRNWAKWMSAMLSPLSNDRIRFLLFTFDLFIDTVNYMPTLILISITLTMDIGYKSQNQCSLN